MPGRKFLPVEIEVRNPGDPLEHAGPRLPMKIEPDSAFAIGLKLQFLGVGRTFRLIWPNNDRLVFRFSGLTLVGHRQSQGSGEKPGARQEQPKEISKSKCRHHWANPYQEKSGKSHQIKRGLYKNMSS